MFEDSLLNEGKAAGRRRRSGIAIAASVTLQACIGGCALAIPMLWPEELPAVHATPQRMMLMARRPALKPVKPQPVKMAASSLKAPAAGGQSAPQPTVELRRGGALARAALSVDDAGSAAPLGGVGAMAFSSGSGSLFGTGRAGAGAGPAVALVRPPAAGPLTISSGVSAGLLLTPIRPEYPKIAIAVRQQGAVVVTATIDKTGRIVGLQVVSGPAMLRQAAVEAIAAARYRPYLLDGQPTEVITTITVKFRMGE